MLKWKPIWHDSTDNTLILSWTKPFGGKRKEVTRWTAEEHWDNVVARELNFKKANTNKLMGILDKDSLHKLQGFTPEKLK